MPDTITVASYIATGTLCKGSALLPTRPTARQVSLALSVSMGILFFAATIEFVVLARRYKREHKKALELESKPRWLPEKAQEIPEAQRMEIMSREITLREMASLQIDPHELIGTTPWSEIQDNSGVGE
ncbi:hypothetical protein AOQ84DRAFT_381550 [Glonium stellatum]|uniref:Uncharacterized protein n=1 Tax=Glonium stellatum TaxID=574774 RepID=A0A8E2ERU9_9PEZI|nr:hypothetical protein AOQ84DRAFT_381550 [Glonium stellatum]